VETQSQLDFLLDRGCYVIQGYLFSRPVAAGELGDLLRSGVKGHLETLALQSGVLGAT
jgi:EAL domain-containing protein (putative c-di-GMP-specific phosphodiesterase class I)